MRILMTSDHIYPAFPSILDSEINSNRNYKSSFSSRFLQDLIAKGLVELGHQVFYWLPLGNHQNVPSGIEIVDQLPLEIDIAHLLYCNVKEGPIERLALIREKNIPWVGVRHMVETNDYSIHQPYLDNLIFVSEYAAHSFGKERFVYNGFDPSEYIFQEQKEDYYFFICSMNKAEEKGLSIALSLAQKMNFPLVVAGNSPSSEVTEKITKQCQEAGATYIGPAYGLKKAKLFAGAKALLFPTLLSESFGGVAVEAMMSGTPVVASDKGALPEIMSSEVGFVCSSMQDYEKAIEKIDSIEPNKCLQYGINNFHYLKMAENYVQVYLEQIARSIQYTI